MGTSSGFMLRNKDHPETPGVCLLYIQNYTPLEDWVRRHNERRYVPPGKQNEQNESSSDLYGEFILDKNDIFELLHTIDPVVKELRKFDGNRVAYYDDNGYPKKYYELFYDNDFSPATACGSFPGTKAMRVYDAVVTILEIYDWNDENQIMITGWCD